MLRVELMRIHHDNPLTDHYRMIKTTELLLRNYYFPDIYAYIKKYISICNLYSYSKISRYSKYNEFALFSIPFDF